MDERMEWLASIERAETPDLKRTRLRNYLASLVDDPRDRKSEKIEILRQLAALRTK